MPPSRPDSTEGLRDEEPILLEAYSKQPLHNGTQDMPIEAKNGPCHIDRSNGSPSDTPGGGSTPVSIGQLGALNALEKECVSQANQLGERLQLLHLSCGLNRRLIRISAFVYRAMAGHFHTPDQKRFLDTYNAGEGLLNEARFGSGTATEVDGDAHTVRASQVTKPWNWMEILPPAHRNVVLRFLDKVRSDPAFVADRLSTLQSSDLIALTSRYNSAIVPDSVLPGQFNRKAYRSTKDGGVDPEQLWPQELGQNDAIFLLLHGIFDDSLEPFTWELRQRTEIWANICAKFLAGRKRGSDEVLTTTLDAFANFQEWALKPRLESYIAKVLRNGAFLLETPTNHFIDFQEPIETQNAKIAVSACNFFETSIQDLLELLADHLPQTISTGLRNLVQSILAKVEDPKLRSRAEIFIISKWFFCSFISSMIMYPEVSHEISHTLDSLITLRQNYGMLMTDYIGDTARVSILKELVVRLQKQVFDVTSPW